MAPQRDYNRNELLESSSGSSSGGSTIDAKQLYVALESSASASDRSFSMDQRSTQYYNAGFNGTSHQLGKQRLGGDMMNNGRCPHHVKLGDSEWVNVERPVNPNRVSYQVR